MGTTYDENHTYSKRRALLELRVPPPETGKARNFNGGFLDYKCWVVRFQMLGSEILEKVDHCLSPVRRARRARRVLQRADETPSVCFTAERESQLNF